MDDLLLSKEWFRCLDGYRLVQSSEKGGAKSETGERIVANSHKIVSYRPFAQYDMLWSAFAEVKSSNDLLAFVQKFGPLDLDGFDGLNATV